MQNRTTFMERLSERLTAIEAVLKKLEPVEGLLERVALLENTIYTTKKVFTFQEACMYIGVSESMLYKLTSNKEIPHYKPRGKMLYFAKEELDAWLLQNYEPTVDDAMRMATEVSATQPFFNQKRYGKRKRTDRNSWAELDENRLSDILTASQIKATDTYETPPQIIWIDNSTIATLGNFSASTGKAKAKKTFNVSAIVAASLAGRQVLNYRAHLPEGKRKFCTWTLNRAVSIATTCWNAFSAWRGCPPRRTTRISISFACGNTLLPSVSGLSTMPCVRTRGMGWSS